MRRIHFDVSVTQNEESLSIGPHNTVGTYTDGHSQSPDTITKLGLITEISIKPYTERIYVYTVSGYMSYGFTVHKRYGITAVFDTLDAATLHMLNRRKLNLDSHFAMNVNELIFSEGLVLITETYSVTCSHEICLNFELMSWTLLKNHVTVPWPGETEENFVKRQNLMLGRGALDTTTERVSTQALTAETRVNTIPADIKYITIFLKSRQHCESSDKNIGRFLREHFPENYARLTSWLKEENMPITY